MWWNGERVMGVLAVSRSIGDHYLRPFVIAQPEVRVRPAEVLKFASLVCWCLHRFCLCEDAVSEGICFFRASHALVQLTVLQLLCLAHAGSWSD